MTSRTPTKQDASTNASRPRGDSRKTGSFLPLIEKIDRGLPVDDERRLGPAFRAGMLVRSMRKQAGLTQAMLAAMLEVSQARISEIEAGAGTQGPSWDIMERVAHACGAKIGILPDPAPARTESALASAQLALGAGRVEDALHSLIDLLSHADQAFNYVSPVSTGQLGDVLATLHLDAGPAQVRLTPMDERYLVMAADRTIAGTAAKHPVSVILGPVAVAGEEKDVVAWLANDPSQAAGG